MLLKRRSEAGGGDLRGVGARFVRGAGVWIDPGIAAALDWLRSRRRRLRCGRLGLASLPGGRTFFDRRAVIKLAELVAGAEPDVLDVFVVILDRFNRHEPAAAEKREDQADDQPAAAAELHLAHAPGHRQA